ncbi:MAG TPA: sigma-54 dependent transcriptional regulator [Solimonas sp.]|nr:sigma-54 dependent transcriptional regulator [Solimonas sp.]
MTITPTPTSVLLVDDDPAVLRSFRRCLEDDGIKVDTAQSGTATEAALGRATFDACVLDLNLGEESGMDLLPKLREWAPWMRVVMATAVDDVSTALGAIRAGAADYLVKPCSPDQLLHAVRQQIDARRMEGRIEALESVVKAGGAELDIDTRSPPLMATFTMARQVAETDASVLILGDSGTGKTSLARAIHTWSKRSKAVLATVSCPSLSPDLLASELFGHVRGAFTGAVDNRQGRVQVADGGTLFLDEIGDLPLALQPRLLRFLQDQEYERVGDPHTRTADVRLIAATNHNLAAMVSEGSFREDLFYRLNVVTLTMPPLRERREDIVILAEKLLVQFVRQHNRPARRFSPEASAALIAYDWPGNLRELRNVVERAAILATGELIRPEYLPFARHARHTSAGLRAGDPVSIDELERAHIQAVLASTPTLEAAAKTLGIDASTLYRKRRQYEVLA